MEVAAGKLKSTPVSGAAGRADVVQWTLATAASMQLNVIRAFGHGVSPSFPLQYKPGASNTRLLYIVAYWCCHWACGLPCIAL